MTRMFDGRSSEAYNRYVEGLSNALTARDWVYDPSFALSSDAEIYSKVMRDPVAAHAIRFRKHLVAGVDWRIEPASEEPNDIAAARILEDILERMSGFTDARIRLADSIFRGSSYAFISGERQFVSVASGEMQAWWLPTALVDVDRRRFRLTARDGDLRWEFWSVLRRAWEWLEHPEWFVRSVFEDTEDSLGYGRGLLDTLHYFQASKARVFQDCLAASERFGQGFIMAGVDGIRGSDGSPTMASGRDGDSVAARWQTTLNKQRARHILVFDKRDEVSILTGSSEGWKLLSELLSYLDTTQVTAVLGSSLSTMQSMGEVGSNAKALTHENSTEALVQADRLRLGDDLSRDLIGQIWRQNQWQIQTQLGGVLPRMPRLKIGQQKKEDPEQAATIISTLLGAGIPLRSEDVYSRTGFTMPREGDAVIEGASAPPPPPAGGGFPFQATGGQLIRPEELEELRGLLTRAHNGRHVVHRNLNGGSGLAA